MIMSLKCVFTASGFSLGEAVLLRLAKFLDEAHGLALKAAGELTANAAREQLHQLVSRHIKQLVQIYSSVGVFSEGSLLGLNFRHFVCYVLSTNKNLNKLKLLNYKLPRRHWAHNCDSPDAAKRITRSPA